ncbi:MAG: hypothetical protein ACEPOV_13910 [Hyphomicrobiales bacterium]
MKKHYSPKHIYSSLIISIIVLFIYPNVTKAQFYNGSQMTFGKNRVQYDKFIWTYYRMEKMDIYFYQEGKELAEYTGKYAIKEITKAENLLKTELIEKMQFLVFNNYSDFRQSNIGLKEEENKTGGRARIYGNKVMLYFNGSHNHLEQQIKEGISLVLFRQMVFGSSLFSQVKNNTLVQFPIWYEQGLISYISNSWSIKSDNQLRDLLLTKRIKSFNQLCLKNPTLAGQSLWYYIEQTNGKARVKELLQLARLRKPFESAILIATGLKHKELYKNWYSFYKERYESHLANDFIGQTLKLKYRDDLVITAAQKQNNGSIVAYATNELGQSSLWLYDTAKRKRKRIYKKGYRTDDFEDLSYPLISWHPYGKVLAFVIEDKGKVYLHLYNVEKKDLQVRNLHHFNKVVSISYHPNGTHILMSAIKKGQSDIFLYNITSNTYEQLTDDIYDDLQAVFTQNKKYIIFSSNRPHDTLYPINKGQEALSNRTQIFAYNFANRKNRLVQVSKEALGNNFNPQGIGGNDFIFLSDRSGRNNIYRATIDSAISKVDTIVHYRYTANAYCVTDFSNSILHQSTSDQGQSINFVVFNKGRYKVIAAQTSDLPSKQILPQRTYLQERQLKQYLIDNRPKLLSTGANTTITKTKVKKRKRFTLVRRAKRKDKKAKSSQKAIAVNDSTGIINNPNNLLSTAEDSIDLKKDTLSFPKRRNYRVEYFINNITARLDYSYLNTDYQPYSGANNNYFAGPNLSKKNDNNPVYLNGGYNGFLQVGITDLMEDYRLSGGLKISPSFINNEYIGSFSNLKKRWDKKLLVHRQIYENATDKFITRTFSHEAYFRLSYPFDEALRYESTLSYRNEQEVYLAANTYGLKQDDKYRNWAIIRQALVFDATRKLGTNLYEGTRYKIFGEYYQKLETIKANLFVVGVDFRKYTRIHKDFIWANRFAASSSFGSNKLLYYMGGVDGWMFAKFNQSVPVDYKQNWAFQTLATNMRGFKQNIRNGNNFFLINTELRFPVFRYLFNRPLSSEFLNSFQIIGFGDLGTAWTGWNPFSKENALYTYYINNGPMRIRVETDLEPIIAGFGGGLRAKLLGYFIRADFAWGVENMGIKDPQFYLSLSLDF